MKCFTKISLVVLSCFTLARSQDLNQFVNDLLGKTTAETTNVNANPTEINDQYTPEDIRKYTKFLINVINGDNQPAPVTTTTTTALPQPTTPASNLLAEVRDISTELDQIKERKVDEIYELVDILKNVSSRLEVLEDTVENLAKQEQEPEQNNTIPNTVPDNGVVDLDNAEIDTDGAAAEPVTDNDLKYVTLFNELNKQNEEKIASMQESQIKILGEIKELLANNNKAAAAEPAVEPIVNVDGDAKAVVEVTDANLSSEVNAAPAPETTEESIKEQLAIEDEEFNKLYDDIKQNISDYKKALSRKVSADEQFTLAAVIRDKSKTIKQYINKLTSLAKTEDQKAKVKEINDKYDNAESDQIEIANNDEQVVNDEAAAKESVEGAKNIVTVDHMKKIINNVAASTTNEEQVEEVRRILKEIQLDDVETKAEEAEAENADLNALVGDALQKVASNTVNEEQVEDVRDFIKTIEANQAAEAQAQAQAENVDVDALVNDALQKVASNTVNEEQVEEVREFIKSIEANKILDDNLKKDEVVRNLIFNIASSTTNEEQVKQVQRIIEKMQLYNKFAEDTQQEQEDNLAFGLRMAEEIQKSPEQITEDLKDMLVNLVNNAKTDEDAANIANIIDQIKKHDELIKEAAEQETGDIKVPNVEAYVVDLDNGNSNEIYLKEEYDFPDNAQPAFEVPIVESVPKIELEIDDTEKSGNGKGVLILGALGVIALAGAGYTYRSKAKKMNDEFPFSDSNLPFSNSMNGLVVDKHFLFNKKNSIPMPEHIVNNDGVIRPSQPSWATSMLMDENNKKGLKEKNLQMTEDPEELLDEQLREIQNKEKVIVKPNTSVVINIDENGVTTKEPTETPKKSKKVKKPKLRRSMGSMTLDKKAKEGKDETSEKKSKKHKKDKARKTKSMFVENKKNDEELLDEELERSLNTSFILDVPPNLFEEMENEKNKKLLNAEKPKVPKRISSCVSLEANIDKATFEKAKMEKAKVEKAKVEKANNEMSDCPFTDEFTKEIMEDYNKKFVEMEKEN